MVRPSLSDKGFARTQNVLHFLGACLALGCCDIIIWTTFSTNTVNDYLA